MKRAISAGWAFGISAIKKAGVTLFKPKSGVAALPPRIGGLSEALESTCRDVEPDFMHLGVTIQSLYRGTTELTSHTRDVVARIGGNSDDAAVARVGRVVTESLEKLEMCRSGVTARLARFSEMTDRLGTLHRGTDEVEKIGRFLKVAGFNIGIESARSMASREMFTVVSREILQLSGKIIEMSGNIRNDSSEARSSQESALAVMFEDLSRLDQLVGAGKLAVASAYRKIEQITALSLDVLENASEHTRKVSVAVGEVVVGVQFHDSLSQRIDHIAKALAEAGNLCARGAANTEKKELAAAHSIVSLQSAQLRRVISEIGSVYQRNRTAIGRIGIEIDEIVERLSGLKKDKVPTREEGSGDPFQYLQSEITRLHHLLHQGEALMDRIGGMAARVSQVTRKLSGYAKAVRGIGYETHIKALNAIVNAAHLGDGGKTLEVLAQHIKDASDDTDRFVAEVAGIIESISAGEPDAGPGLTDADTAGQGANPPGLTSSDDKARTAETVITEIAGLYDRFSAGSTEAFQLAEALKQAVSKAQEELEFLPALEGRLSRLSDQLEDIGRMLIPWADENPDGTAHLAERYTMREERAVHEQIAAFTAVREEAPPETGFAPNADGGGTEDDLGDNVELF